MAEKNKPKRILALSGGGIRGALTLGFLEKIEEEIRKTEPGKKLRDHYDLIGGTSTGAIISAGLAKGMDAADITDLYKKLGKNIFGKKRNLIMSLIKKSSFDFRPLDNALKDAFGDLTIGSPEVKQGGLCIVTKRADTFSTWPIFNHPKGKFYNDGSDEELGYSWKANKNFPLWQVVRASAAAPTYFAPRKLSVDYYKDDAVFVDGGVSLSNNPSMQLFLLATLKAFPYQWETGADKLSLTSIGTGDFKRNYDKKKIFKKGMLGWAKLIPDLFMHDADYFNQTMMQYMSDSPTAQHIDGEIGDLKNDKLTDKPLLKYIRYNVRLDKETLDNLGFKGKFTDEKIESFREMSDHTNIEPLYEIGREAAKEYVKEGHLK